NYDLKRLIPYFILAIGFVIASMLIPYKNMAIELFVNTILLLLFILYAEKRDKLLTVIFKGN
ncbi:MAG: lipopolysaccharide biosynthesis protein, partial [Bacteroidales bacterium]|nr:lipopolysaccharide biosynthesis protein [Bacteroidales bacterium]